MNSCRWDCNVFGLSPKVTVGNYVRNVSGAGASTRCPVRPRRRTQAPQPGPPDPPVPSISAAPGLLCVAPSCPPLNNFARNSPASTSIIEFMSLGLQRFRAISKSDRGKLCASFAWLAAAAAHWHRGRFLRCPPVPSGPSGALHSCVAAKEPRFRLLIGGIALLREALHCLVASTLLAYLVHRFLKQHIPAHAHGYADRLLLHG